MSVVSVQSTECSYPQLSGSILSDTLHTSVRQFLSHHQVVFLIFIKISICRTLTLTSQHHRSANQT